MKTLSHTEGERLIEMLTKSQADDRSLALATINAFDKKEMKENLHVLLMVRKMVPVEIINKEAPELSEFLKAVGASAEGLIRYKTIFAIAEKNKLSSEKLQFIVSYFEKAISNTYTIHDDFDFFKLFLNLRIEIKPEYELTIKTGTLRKNKNPS